MLEEVRASASAREGDALSRRGGGRQGGPELRFEDAIEAGGGVNTILLQCGR